MRVDFPKNSKQQECMFCGCADYLLKYNGLIMCPICMEDRNIHGDFLDHNNFDNARPVSAPETGGRVIWVGQSVFTRACNYGDVKFSSSK